MPKLTEERFKHIVKNIYPPAGTSRGVDNFIKEVVNHPEIKSLFAVEDSINCKYCGSSNTVVEHHDADNSDRVYCKTCCRQFAPPTEPPAPVAEYEVIEYEETQGEFFGEYRTKCTRRDDFICFTGGVNCEACKHFAGHEVEGKSLRCKHLVNGGEV